MMTSKPEAPVAITDSSNTLGVVCYSHLELTVAEHTEFYPFYRISEYLLEPEATRNCM